MIVSFNFVGKPCMRVTVNGMQAEYTLSHSQWDDWQRLFLKYWRDGKCDASLFQSGIAFEVKHV